MLKGKKKVAVIERVMPGGASNGPLFNEFSALAQTKGLKIKLENYILGLGGRDVNPEEFREIFENMSSPKKKTKKKEKSYQVIGVRA